MYEREVFANAMQKPTDDERDRYLDEACRDDTLMRERIVALLEAERELGSFMEPSPVVLAETLDVPLPADQSGSVIGCYRLVEQIGEGGFGVVYLAEQLDPVQRKVALKLIKPGMDTKEVIARFTAERRALALMDHPHIAKVLDCGATDHGVPYFVMELVSGIPVTDYCDHSQLTTIERLKLFVSVCRAVQHAHQKGVIHRDIKPSNVLVATQDGLPVPKIIDFGIAKAIDSQLTKNSLCTESGRMVGTPLYMSPEQAGLSGLDVDTRTDVYSLGVLLYELLTGVTPFERQQFEDVDYDELRRLIRDEEPTKPSTKVSRLGATATTVSACRKTDPKKLSALLRHDLDWIVMKALEKDRERRYETATSLAADVQRFLNNDPVEACPPSPVYRCLKFSRRYRRTLVTTAAFVALMAAGTSVSVWQAVRATQSERMAKAEAEVAESVVAFLNRDLLGPASPTSEPDRDLKVREALDRASATIKDRFRKQPLVEAAIRHAVGTAYITLGEFGKAERHLLRAVEVRMRERGDEHRDTLASRTHLAIAVADQGRHAEAEQIHRSVLELQRRKRGAEHPDSLASMMNLSAAVFKQGRYAESEQLTRDLLDIQRRVQGAEHPSTLRNMINLVIARRAQSDYDNAEEICRNVLAIQQRVLDDAHPDTLTTMSTLANVLLAQERLEEGEALHRQVYQIRENRLGSEHPDTLASINNLSTTVYRRGRFAEAERLRLKQLEIQSRVLGSDHPSTLRSMMNLANILEARGRPIEAERLQQQVLQARERVLGENHPDTLTSRFNLARMMSAQGHHSQAEQIYRDLLDRQRKLLPPDHPQTLRTMMNLTVVIHRQKRYADAEALRREILDVQLRILGPDHHDTLVSTLNLANSIHAQHRHEEAEKIYREVHRKMQVNLGDEHPFTMKAEMALASVNTSRENFAEAEALHREVLAKQRRLMGDDHPDTLHTIRSLAWLLCLYAPVEQQRPAEAVELAEELIRHKPTTAGHYRVLGHAQYRSGDLKEAEQTLLHAAEINGLHQHDQLTLVLIQWHLGETDLARSMYESIEEPRDHNPRLMKLDKEAAALLESGSAAQLDAEEELPRLQDVNQEPSTCEVSPARADTASSRHDT